MYEPSDVRFHFYALLVGFADIYVMENLTQKHIKNVINGLSAVYTMELFFFLISFYFFIQINVSWNQNKNRTSIIVNKWL